MVSQSIGIGDVTIDDVEILQNGVVRKIGVRPRFRNPSLIDDIMAIANKSLRRLIVMTYNIEHSGYHIGQLDLPILVEYCEAFLDCSEKTAYNYAKTLLYICTILQR